MDEDNVNAEGSVAGHSQESVTVAYATKKAGVSMFLSAGFGLTVCVFLLPVWLYLSYDMCSRLELRVGNERDACSITDSRWSAERKAVRREDPRDEREYLPVYDTYAPGSTERWMAVFDIACFIGGVIVYYQQMALCVHFSKRRGSTDSPPRSRHQYGY